MYLAILVSRGFRSTGFRLSLLRCVVVGVTTETLELDTALFTCILELDNVKGVGFDVVRVKKGLVAS